MSSHKFDSDIIIAGGGLIGLTLALALVGTHTKPTNLTISLVDPNDPEKFKADSRAFSLSASSKNMLEALNLWDELEDDAQAVSDIEITDTKLSEDIRPILLHFDNETEEGDPGAYVIESAILRDVLYKAVKKHPNISFQPPARIVGFESHDYAITAQLDNGKSLRAKLLTACDGRQSALRQKAGIKTVEWKSKQTGITATIKHSLPHNGKAIQHFLPAGPFAMLPLTNNRTSLIWTENQKLAREVMLYDERRFLEEVKKRAAIDLGDLSLENSPSFFPLSMNAARDYIADRFVLVGDSAHGMHWVAGQGLNFGFRDVAALAELVIKTHRLGLDVGSITVLEEYQRWRRFDSFTFTASMATLNGLLSHDNVITRSVRDLGMSAVNKIPAVKKFFIKEATGLSGELPRLLKGERL